MNDGATEMQVFRHSGRSRLAMWFVCLALAAVALGALGAVLDGYLTAGERVAFAVAGTGAAILCAMAFSRARRMQRWRVAVADGAVDLSIPGRRTGLDPAPAVARRVAMGEIERVETRQTDIAGLGKVNTLSSTALRLKDGTAQKIGDTRVGNRFVGADDPGGNAGKVIADALGAPLFERNRVAGKGRLSMLSRVSTPPWDTPPMTPEERDELDRRARRKGLIFAGVFIALSLVGIYLE